jgi:hypothetical protein
MKRILIFLLTSLSIANPLIVPWARADTLTLLGNDSVSGAVLRTNGDSILFLTDYGTMDYERSMITGIKIDPSETKPIIGKFGLPSARNLILLLNKAPWAETLQQIPATVIDNGVLKNVPYISFRCGANYEVNIYGELDRPAGVEIGLYRQLLEDPAAKSNCLDFAQSLLGDYADRRVLATLNPAKDLRTRDELTFEITPPTAADAYHGWWVSIYSEARLNLSRASDAEMAAITSSKKHTSTPPTDASAWTVAELELSRPDSAGLQLISFKDSSGQMVTDAQVVRTNAGVSLIWRQGAGGGVVMLADLPEDLQARFGYDPAKSATTKQADQERKAREWQQAQLAAQTAARAQAIQSQSTSDVGFSGGGYASSSPSAGRVYVRGYFRSNGTYVRPHTRSYPHHR